MRSVLDPLPNPLLDAHPELPSPDAVLERFRQLLRTQAALLAGPRDEAAPEDNDE